MGSRAGVILLDTCAAIWAATEDPSLTRGALATIADAAARRQLHISAISAWEITTLERRGRLSLTMPAAAFVDRLFGQPGVVECPVDRYIASAAGELGEELRGDPADRVIVATAIVQGLRLLTRDARLLRFAKRTKELLAQAC
jgi:PIN domain nuclease of toxin-antitoxin system